MTKAEAYKTLGVGKSTSRSKAELVYREKCKELRSQLVPGVPTETRTKAGAELARLAAAWQTIRTEPAHKTRTPKTATAKSPPKPPRPERPAVRPCQKPQTLGEAWEQVVSQMPFSEPVAVLILILMLLIAILSLLSALL